ncbi:22.0 kDa class IV heat shock protein-like [Rutidosis leptorrhynchoides]|uniref:22.0 kDa class IV heat shock protein-like n=1 Tax=Rutidosis leptorrhynchoides TaxID=125765 RepID=UPI003A99D8C1
MKTKLIILSSFLYFLILTSQCSGSLLSLLNNHQTDPILSLLSSKLLTNPFQELEQIPFGLERDDEVITSPAHVDWKETRDSHVISMDVPGLKKHELKIEVEENRVLRVSGERKRESNEGGNDTWHRSEKMYGKFWRQFRLPENVDLDNVNAKLEDGVLVITIGKLAPDRVKGPKVVSIGGGESPAAVSMAETKSEL